TDGFYAVEKIMTLDSDAKVVAVTADFTLETEERLKKMNVSAIIYKPFNQMQIRQILLEKYKIKIQ
ncbi:MAG: response regulator, partial [Nitrosarchaeum sp.]